MGGVVAAVRELRSGVPVLKTHLLGQPYYGLLGLFAPSSPEAVWPSDCAPPVLTMLPSVPSPPVLPAPVPLPPWPPVAVPPVAVEAWPAPSLPKASSRLDPPWPPAQPSGPPPPLPPVDVPLATFSAVQPVAML